MTETVGVPAAFPCACCGFLVFSEPLGSYDICPVCDWEDDALQLEFATTLAGGANRLTLAEAQARFQSAPASRPPGGMPRDPEWRPIDPARDRFEDFAAPSRPRAPDEPEALYYWRASFWRYDLTDAESEAGDGAEHGLSAPRSDAGACDCAVG